MRPPKAADAPPKKESAETEQRRQARLEEGRHYLAQQKVKIAEARRDELAAKNEAVEAKAARLAALRDQARAQRRRGTPEVALRRLAVFRAAREKALRKMHGLDSDDSDADRDGGGEEEGEPPVLLQSADQRLNAQHSLNVAADGDEVGKSSAKVLSSISARGDVRGAGKRALAVAAAAAAASPGKPQAPAKAAAKKPS